MIVPSALNLLNDQFGVHRWMIDANVGIRTLFLEDIFPGHSRLDRTRIEALPGRSGGMRNDVLILPNYRVSEIDLQVRWNKLHSVNCDGMSFRPSCSFGNGEPGKSGQ